MMMLPDINAIDMANWNAIKAFLNCDPEPPTAADPLRMDEGLICERYKEGYRPASKPITSPPPTTAKMCGHNDKVNVVPATLLNTGNTISIRVIDNTTEAIAINKDSKMNCSANCLRRAPSDLRTPISFARSVDRAVVRFMKFTHAIMSVRNPAVARMYT